MRHIATMSENQTRCCGDDRVRSEFSIGVTSGDDFLYESKLWRHNCIHTQAPSGGRAREDGDMKRVHVKFSDDPDWNTELNQLNCMRVVRTGKRNS